MAHAQHQPDAPASPGAHGADKRRHKRRSGMWKAHLQLGLGQHIECIILDLSESGAKLLVKQPLLAGKVVTLVAESIGARGARIAWVTGNRAGVAFLEGSADLVGSSGMPFASFAREAASPPSAPAAMNAPFLRGRAQVLRELARSNPDPAKAATLLRSAEALEAEAAQVERRQRF